jgi:hypothetical protein
MKVYSIKRYEITSELRNAVINHPDSMRKIGRLLGFEIKNIIYKNKSINEEHWNKLKSLLCLDLQLKEIEFDFTKNLGTGAFMQPIKSLKKSGDLAEFIGIMLGDGSLPYKNNIRIAFDKRNPDYIDYVGKLCEKLFGIKFKKTYVKDRNTAYLYCYNKYLILELINLGLKRGDKIKNQLGVPDWIKDSEEYSKRCIKGLIDTDGCIFICKREKQKYVNFTNHNNRLFEDFKKMTKKLGYSFAKSNSTNTRLYRKKEVVRFINDIKPLKSIYGVVV